MHRLAEEVHQNRRTLNSSGRALGHIRNTTVWNRRMKVELFSPDPETIPRHWVRQDQAFAMMFGPGSIQWGQKRSSLHKLAYTSGAFVLCALLAVPRLGV